MSAYACEPGKGSEPEVGWRWMLEMSKYHDVVVLTRANNREVIESYLQRHPDRCSGVEFVYFDLSHLMMKWKKRLKWHELYYVFWQYQVRKEIDRQLIDGGFDLVHLVTFASFRYPVFLGKLGTPVVWGPVGGAELAPWKLLAYRLRFPACIKEVVRNLATTLSGIAVRWVDPTRTSGGRVIASTPRTQQILNQRQVDAGLMPTIGMNIGAEGQHSQAHPADAPVKFIFVGRLVLLKGAHLLLEGFARAELSHARLTIVGDGSERRYLERLTDQLGIRNSVEFLGYVEKKDLPRLYAEHSVVVAPSLYESGGYMVLEAFQQRRPAIVLDVGGPSMSVDSSCGIKVAQGSGAEVVQGLASAMSFYVKHPETIAQHGQAGFKRLSEIYAWKNKGLQMNKFYQQAVNTAQTVKETMKEAEPNE